MTDTLSQGQRLTIADQLTSANGRIQLIMQSDGNLVLYQTDTGAARWASNTAGKPVSQAIMQEDGNFVCYSLQGQPYWASNTNGNTGAYIILQDGSYTVTLGGQWSGVTRTATFTVD